MLRYITAALHALVIGIPLWLGLSLLWLPLFIIGVPICAVLAWNRSWIQVKSDRFPKKHPTIAAWRYSCFELWGNDEDGVTGDAHWWPTYCADKSERGWLGKLWLDDRFQSFFWSAIRNPVNNFRFSKMVDFGLDPDRIRWVGNSIDCRVDLDRYRRGEFSRRTFWFYCWHGMYPAFWLIHVRDNTTHARLRLGWKHTPAFMAGVPADDYRSQSESFTPCQLGLRRLG